MSAFLDALKKNRPWVNRFTRFDYREAFQDYRDVYEKTCRLQLSEMQDYVFGASAFMDELEQHWKKQFFFNRTAERVDCRMTAVSYFIPMLLLCDEERARVFAEALKQERESRYPKEKLGISDYETILNGFRFSILGVDIERKHLSKTKDAPVRKENDGNPS